MLEHEEGGKQRAWQQSAHLQSAAHKSAHQAKGSFQGGHPGGALSGSFLDRVSQKQRIPAPGRHERRMVAKMRSRQKTGLDSVLPFSGYTLSKFSRETEIWGARNYHLTK